MKSHNWVCARNNPALYIRNNNSESSFNKHTHITDVHTNLQRKMSVSHPQVTPTRTFNMTYWWLVNLTYLCRTSLRTGLVNAVASAGALLHSLELRTSFRRLFTGIARSCNLGRGGEKKKKKENNTITMRQRISCKQGVFNKFTP